MQISFFKTQFSLIIAKFYHLFIFCTFVATLLFNFFRTFFFVSCIKATEVTKTNRLFVKRLVQKLQKIGQLSPSFLAG